MLDLFVLVKESVVIALDGRLHGDRSRVIAIAVSVYGHVDVASTDTEVTARR